MKATKRFILILVLIFSLVTFVSCSSVEQAEITNKLNEKISLNVEQADLIASITDNEKYLNKDLLYSLDKLEDDDKINLIITMESKGLMDYYENDSQGYNTLSEFLNSRSVSSVVKNMISDQKNLANELIGKDYISKMNHSYTTLFNGFSVTTTYGQYKKLVRAGYDIDITISEVYSQPEYQLASSDDKETGTDIQDAVTNYVDVYETGIFDSSNVDFDGSNTAVAILDSGFDIHHTVFQKMPNETMLSATDISNILYESNAYGYKQNIKVQDVYMNAKIPFAYDYADKDPDVAPYDSNHGTHVAGIIGGSDERITGVAINTQLVLMKVFGDINNGALQEDILAALEDAMLIGVDAINLSLGTACGFARSSDNEYINEVYDKIEAAGISLVVAASNDYSSGYGGENGNTNKASNPDSATIGSPGSYASTISVASISGVKSKYMVHEDGYVFFFNSANNNAGKPLDFYDMLFEDLGTTKTKIEVEYVTVPGVGKKVNYSSVDVKGKIALVKRGETSFEEKAQVALAQGAIGCIIYNNVAGEVFMNAGSHLEIPLCSVSKDDGEYLASKGTGKLILDKSYLAGPFMSDFSSWGPVSNLALKPEITAHGGSILSAVPGGGYEEISGTSMACPNLCGVIVLVKQALKERYPDITPVELTNMANSLLMSTATIVLDEQGNPYSPRKQGSGLGNLKYAIDTLAYLSVEDQTKPKLELKDDPNETGVYELVFDINNISNQSLQYKLNNLTMTESLSVSDPEYVAEKAYMLNPKTNTEISGNGTLVDDVITVDAGGTVTVKYTLTLTDAEKEYISRSFINGMYVEGFAVLESLNEDKINLSIPFLAFFGDWTKAPMFDKTYYEVESEKYNGAIDEEDKLKADYYASTPLGTYYYSYIIPLGSYVYEMDEQKYDKIPASEEHAAIGYNLETINGITTVYAGLLRNAKKMTTVIKNAYTGEVVYEHVKYDEHKAYFSGSIIPGYDIINITAADLGLQNNTKYTFTMEAELDYDDGGVSDNLNNTFEFSFYVDFQAPIITDAEYYSKYDKSLKDYRYYVDVYVYDNHYAQSIRPFTIIDGTLVSLSEYPIPIYGEKGEISKVTIEITDYIDLLQYGWMNSEGQKFPVTNGLGFLVDDYALNQSYSYVTLPGTNSSEIAYQDKYFSSVSNGTYQYYKDIYVGDTLDLTTMLTSNDLSIDSDPAVQAKYFSLLSWKSSNEDVIKVKNGKIEAVGDGTALITCTTMNTDGYAYEIDLRIRVRKRSNTEDLSDNKLTDIEFTYFDTLKAFIDGPDVSEIGEVGQRFFFTEKSSISMYPSEQVQLGYELEPWNLKDYELIWSSTNEKVATVDENGIITGLKEGNATITLKVKVDGRTSTLMASTKVTVKSEFVIEGTTLVAYKGLGGNVVIPADEGILYIGAFAFSLYTTDYEIKIEEDDYDAAKTPASNDSVKSVTIPSDVMEVQKYAFYNCTALETVTFLKDDKGETCPYIREYAFAGDKKLKNINLEGIELIGERAFDKCESLVDVKLSSLYAIGYQAFRSCTGIKHVDLTALRNAAGEEFIGCTSLETIDNGEFTNFSEGMFKNTALKTLTFNSDRIPNNCFENCKNLKDVTITRTIVYVGKQAFNKCTSLETVTFNDFAGCEFIYEEAFANCVSLNSIMLPDSNFEFETNVFNNANNLTELKFNKNTNITTNLGLIFNGCNKLSTFVVDKENNNFKGNDNLLLSKDGKEIILAAPKYEYGDYTISEGIESIKESAFSGVTTLTSLTLPNSLEYIGKFAFGYCENLTTLTLVENITIDEKAFGGCKNLSTINNIEYIKNFAPYVFANTAIVTLSLEDVVISESAFAGITTLKEVRIKTNIELGKRAFANCENLETIIIDAPALGEESFNNCTKLNNITLTNVSEIKSSVFKGCTTLSNIESSIITKIGDYAFSDCTNLSNISFENVEEIGAYAFASTDLKITNQLTNVTFGDTLKLINNYAFANCANLTTVNLGSNIEYLGSFAFSNCPNLTSFATTSTIKVINEAVFAEDELLVDVEINGIEYINDAAFYNCYALENIDLSNVVEIGMQAFNNCNALISVNLPKVKKLGPGAFLQAYNLTNINVPVIEYIDAQALSCIGIEEIKLPATLTYVAPTAFYYNLNHVKFTNDQGKDTCEINDYIRLDKGVLYTATANDKYLLSAYPTAKPDETYEVLFNTVRIEEYAGYFNNKIEKLILPDTLKLIGNMSFYGCTNLITVEFKSTVAPILEGTISSLNIEYESNTEIYKLLNKYFQFNGYYPLFYGQFKDMVGMAKKMTIIIPENADEETYKDTVYSLYFEIEKMQKSTYTSLNANSIDYLNKVSIVPTEVSLSDKKIIEDARTAYNLLSQDLTNYGYSKEYLDNLYNNLVEAETKWNMLQSERINKVYKHLISDIEKLGNVYEFEKIADYYKIVEALENVNRDDKAYIDDKNVEEFKKGFDEYFKDLNDDVNTLTEVGTLPTTTVNKVGLIVAATSFVTLASVLVLVLKRKWLF